MIEEVFETVIKPGVTGFYRRREFERCFLKLGLFICKGDLHLTAKYVGYSYRWVFDRIKNDIELREYYGDVCGGQINSNDIFIEFNEGKIKTIDEIRMNRIEDTKKKFWFKQLSVSEQRQVIKRINDLYDYGEPDI